MQRHDSMERAPRGFAAIGWRGSTLAGGQVGEFIERAAAGLASLGVRVGDRIGILLRNCPELLVVHQAVRTLGALPVPVNWHAADSEVAFVLDDCGASVVVAHSDFVRMVSDAPRDLVIVDREQGGRGRPRGVHWNELLAHGRRTETPTNGARESIIYTSGTSGRPKGVRRLPASDAEHAAARLMRERLYGSAPTARLLIAAPLYHAAPLQFAQHVLAAGELVVIEERFDAEGYLRAIEEHQITHAFAVPTMFGRILALDDTTRHAYDVGSLSFVLHAGAPCPPSIKQRIIEEWGTIVHEYYGSTELGPVTFCDADDWLRRPGTVGRPLNGVDLAFYDSETGAPAVSTPAEIAVRNRVLPDFDYEGREAERRALQRDEFVATGDIGYLDDDGFLFVSDRARDLIISGGVNLYPAEIEAAIQELPGVADCAVFAVPDDDLGEVPAAVVQTSSGLTADDVAEHLAAHMGRLKRPRAIEVCDVLPRQENGKVRKDQLRAAFVAARGAEAARAADAG